MNKDIDFLQQLFGIGESQQLVIPEFLIQLLLTAFLAFLLATVYVRYGNALSNRRALSKTFVLLSLTTMLIITIVKSSLALSLGLVGALSIVRFRTAIKEPEELAYFFISIAIGLGIGAGQIIATIIGTLALILVAVLINRTRQKEVIQNLILHFDAPKAAADLEQVTRILDPHCQQLEMRRLDEAGGMCEVAFAVQFKDFNSLLQAKDALKTAFPAVSFNFLELGK